MSELTSPAQRSSLASGEAFSCPNCGRENQGKYCASCGQKNVLDSDMALKHAWHHLVHETLHVDGKIFHTLKLLFIRPGQLTLDFLEKRRARYVHPIRLFIIFSTIFFFFTSGSHSPVQITAKTFGDTMQKIEKRAAKSDLTGAQVLERINQSLGTAFKAIYITVTIFNGVWLWLLFRKQRRYLAEHMVMALHLACFSLTVGTVGSWFGLMKGPGWIAVAVMYPLTFAYHLLASHRVYGRPWTELVWKMILLLLGTLSTAVIGGALGGLIVVGQVLSSL